MANLDRRLSEPVCNEPNESELFGSVLRKDTARSGTNQIPRTWTCAASAMPTLARQEDRS